MITTTSQNRTRESDSENKDLVTGRREKSGNGG